MPAQRTEGKGRRNSKPAGAPVGPARAGSPAPVGPAVSLILPCPLIVLGTTTAAETGRPLRELLRRIGYL